MPGVELARQPGESKDAFNARLARKKLSPATVREEADYKLIKGFLMYLFGTLLFPTSSHTLSGVILQLTEIYGIAAMLCLLVQVKKVEDCPNSIGWFLPFLQV